MTKLPAHLFVSDGDGALYDTRVPDWHKLRPLRPMYRRTFAEIFSVTEFKCTLRNGAYAWPGGYPMFLLTWDGASLCYDCARKEARNIFSAIADKRNDGWHVCACDINYEESELHCDHCGKQIESAYGEDETKFATGKNADHVDGFDRDDLGESPDY